MSEYAPSVLITGANGFVGARLCRLFLKENYRVIAGVRKTSDLSALSELKVEYRYGDVSKPKSLESMVDGADYVVHNAGIVKARHQRTFFDVNETGTRNLMEAVKNVNPGVKRIVYISSLAAFGPSEQGTPRREEDSPAPLTVYGRSKLAGERAAMAFSDVLPVTAVRPPGVYGPGDREILDFFKAVHGGLRPIIGRPSRKIQLVHVDDLCRGVYRATISDIRSGQSYFIAEKNAYTMSELVGHLQDAVGRRGFPLRLPGSVFKAVARVSETLFRCFGATPMLTLEKARELLASWEVSTERAHRDLGFESEITFREGARSTYQWYLRQGWLK